MTQLRKKCKECRKSFASEKSLFGHMRCHPERTHVPPRESLQRNEPAINLFFYKFGLRHHGRANLEWKVTGRRGRTNCKVSPCKQELLYGCTYNKHDDDQDVQKPSTSMPMTKKRIKVCTDMEEEVGSKKQNSCNICGESFNSYQALGGHMTGRHKKEIIFKDKVKKKKKKEICGSTKIHACKICGTSFSSGQALGGHQRLHYNASLVAGKAGKKDEVKSGAGRQVLDLDLNETPAMDKEGHDQQEDDLCLRLSLS